MPKTLYLYRGGEHINTILVPDSATAETWTAVEDGVTVSEVPPPVPEERLEPVPGSITPRQLRLWLLTQGIPMSAVEQQLTTEAARIEWEYASEIRRDHPLVSQLGEALNLTSGQVDEAFRVATHI